MIFISKEKLAVDVKRIGNDISMETRLDQH